MGACPDEYGLILVARWLGVAPWELAGQSEFWLRWGEIAMRIELDGVKPKEL